MSSSMTAELDILELGSKHHNQLHNFHRHMRSSLIVNLVASLIASLTYVHAGTVTGRKHTRKGSALLKAVEY